MGEWVNATENEKLYIALPEGAAGPAVLVLHAWWGLNEFFQSLCDRLAGEGFVAVAADLFGGRVAHTIPEAEALIQLEQEEPLTQILTDVLDILKTLPAVTGQGIGVIGASMGAWWALKLSVMEPERVRAVVLFYGTGAQDFTRARAAIQGHYAENDPYESAEDVNWLEEQLRAAGREVEFFRYPGTKHWFIETDRPEYDPDAAQLAWERLVAFLHSRLDGEQ